MSRFLSSTVFFACVQDENPVQIRISFLSFQFFCACDQEYQPILEYDPSRETNGQERYTQYV